MQWHLTDVLGKEQGERDEPWRRVEAVRHALFHAADKSQPAGEKFFGQGLLRAHLALDVRYNDSLPKTPADEVSFPWLRMAGVLEATEELDGRQCMYETEALQLFERTPRLLDLVDGADPLTDQLDRAMQKRLLEEMSLLSTASRALRDYLLILLKNL